MAKGQSQKLGVDYNDTFASIGYKVILIFMPCTLDTTPEAARLPKIIWSEAAKKAVVMKNSFSSSGGPTPEEALEWTRRVPDVSNLRVFACVVWFTSRLRWTSSYQVLLKSTRKLIAARDVFLGPQLYVPARLFSSRSTRQNTDFPLQSQKSMTQLLLAYGRIRVSNLTEKPFVISTYHPFNGQRTWARDENESRRRAS